MKKLLQVLVVIVAFLVGAAYWKGWRFYEEAFYQDALDEDLDACSVGIIGCADGPTSILIDDSSLHGVRGIFNRMALFFANRFCNKQPMYLPYKRKSSKRKAEPQ